MNVQITAYLFAVISKGGHVNFLKQAKSSGSVTFSSSMEYVNWFTHGIPKTCCQLVQWLKSLLSYHHIQTGKIWFILKLQLRAEIPVLGRKNFEVVYRDSFYINGL